MQDRDENNDRKWQIIRNTEVWVMPKMTSKTIFNPRVLIHTMTKPRASEAITNLGLPLRHPTFCTRTIVPSFRCQNSVQSHKKIQKEHSLLQWVRSWLDYYESYIPTMCSHLEVTMHIRGSNIEIISYLLLTVDCDTISCIVNEHNCFVHWCFLVWRQKLSALYLFRGASQGRKISASQERKEGSSF